LQWDNKAGGEKLSLKNTSGNESLTWVTKIGREVVPQIPHRLIMFEGADYQLIEDRQEKERQTFEWFDKYVKNRGKLPNLRSYGK